MVNLNSGYSLKKPIYAEETDFEEHPNFNRATLLNPQMRSLVRKKIYPQEKELSVWERCKLTAAKIYETVQVKTSTYPKTTIAALVGLAFLGLYITLSCNPRTLPPEPTPKPIPKPEWTTKEKAYLEKVRSELENIGMPRPGTRLERITPFPPDFRPQETEPKKYKTQIDPITNAFFGEILPTKIITYHTPKIEYTTTFTKEQFPENISNVLKEYRKRYEEIISKERGPVQEIFIEQTISYPPKKREKIINFKDLSLFPGVDEVLEKTRTLAAIGKKAEPGAN